MNRRRFLAIARLELRTVLTRPFFWAFVVAIWAITASINPAALIPSGDPARGLRPFINSPFAVANLFALSGVVLYAFLAAILAGFSVIRDDEHKVAELLHSTPLRPAEYVLGKLAGTLAAVGGVLVLQVLFSILYFQLVPVDDADQVRGAFRLGNFVLPALAFAAPVIWLSACLAFAVGERTRKPLLIFGVPIALFVGCIFVLWTWTPSWIDPRLDAWLMGLDPSGFRWIRQTIFRVDRGVAFYNTQPLPFDAVFLWNRLWVLVVPGLAVITSIRHCAASLTGGRPAGWTRRLSRSRATATPQAAALPGTLGLAAQRLRGLGMTTATPSFAAGTWSLARAELRELVAHPALWLFTPLVMVMVWDHAANATGPMDAPLLMTAGRLAVGVIARMTVPLCLLLLFYTVESLHRERATRFEAILYATPLRTGALLLGKSLANAAVVVIILSGCTLTGIAYLAFQGQGRVELWPFLLVWGLVLGPTFVVWIAFVTALAAIVRERYTTYALGLGALALTAWHQARGSMTWVSNWALWGTLRWSDMGTFDLNGRALWLNRLNMIGLAALFAVLAARRFARAERDPVRNALRRAPSRVLGEALRLVPLALVPILVGTFLSAGVRDGFQGDVVRARGKEYWRRNVATWRDVAIPTVEHLDLAIELEPADRGMAVVGAFTMINDTGRELYRLPFTVGHSFSNLVWTVGDVTVSAEDRAGLHVVELPGLLAPQGRVQVGFRYDVVLPDGVTRNGGGVAEFVLPSGVVLNADGPDLFPVPGFIRGIGVDRDNQADRPEPPRDFWKAELPPVGGIAAPFTTRIEITAPQEYTVNSVGIKTAETTRGERTTVVWESDHPVKAVNLVAGRWDVRRRQGAEVYFHPGHPYNVDEIADTLAAARRRYSEWFHPYPWQELRISEFPDHTANAKGFPTNIPFSEGIGFLTRHDPRVPLAFVVTAHEAAHQWWGNLLTPGEGPGADVLIEGMAHYATLLLQESENGLHGRIEFAKRMEESYADNRRVDAERPLVRLGDDGRPGDEETIYNKGAWTMWMLHNHLGRESMLAGLRDFFQRYVDNPDHPALHDLIETLRPHAADPGKYQAFIDQWFFDVVVPKYRIREAEVAAAGAGWRVSAIVENVGSGTARVELAAASGERFGLDGADYRDERTSLLLTPGEPERVAWTVGFEPDRVVVDPDALVLQLERNRAISRF